MVMNSERLAELYDNPALVSDGDIDMLEKLAGDHPYYRDPFVLLAKAYFDKKHYRFEESLKQAAIRVKDREWLYTYIHSAPKRQFEANTVSIDTPEIPITEALEAEVKEAELVAEMPVVLPVEPAHVETPGNTIEAFLSEGHEPEAVYRTEELSPEIVEEEVSAEPVAETIAPVELKVAEPEIEIAENSIHEEVPRELPEIEFHMSPTGDKSIRPDKEPEIAHFTIESEIEEGPENIHEEKAQPAMELRKYPIYSLDRYLKEEAIPEPFLKPVTETEPSSELDFFAWLDKGKEAKSIENKPVELNIQPEQEEVKPRQEVKKKKSLGLIEQFISHNPTISRPKKEFFSPENMAKRSEQIDLDIVTETLAAIYYEHGSYDLAIAAYEKLSLQNPGKEAYFASLIKKIKERK